MAINVRKYLKRNVNKANEFLHDHLTETYKIKEVNIITMIIQYKTEFEKLDVCYLSKVDHDGEGNRLVEQFTKALNERRPVIYSGSWEDEMSYHDTGHYIRFSYALYHNKFITIKTKLGLDKFLQLEDVIDKDGIRLEYSNWYHPNHID